MSVEKSMINAGIFDGDMVIVEQQPTADNGDIVVAMIEDSATVKRFYKEDGYYRPSQRMILWIRSSYQKYLLLVKSLDFIVQ